ncbi:NnrU family protein [Maritalea mediterranea]|uniref:NnrU family protein n=1 Tax=Maritalea mediterranea TaxID=2909667 RepID=A0ABS9E568_9HYPH|nr:NnrU family protein [Maritalea mediterranea]MCF4098005.1 NnrU family protein [Maritalea mediterranea]
MIEFLIALFVFLFAHMLPQIGDLRGKIIARTSRKAYIIGYSVLSTLLLIWMISAALRAPRTILYAADPLTVRISMGLMLMAIILFVMGALRPNSLSVSFRRDRGHQNSNPGILALVRHPIIVAFALWAFAHILVNGELANILLFGIMLAFALLGIARLNKTKPQKLSAADYARVKQREAGSWGQRLRRAGDRQLAIELVIGIALYIVILHAHGPIIGVDPLAYL